MNVFIFYILLFIVIIYTDCEPRRLPFFFLLTYFTHTGYPETTNATDNNKTQLKSGVNTSGNNLQRIKLIHGKLFPDKNLLPIPVWEHLATDQTDPWQVVPRQVSTPYDCLLISVAFAFLCCVGCLWVTGV